MPQQALQRTARQSVNRRDRQLALRRRGRSTVRIRPRLDLRGSIHWSETRLQRGSSLQSRNCPTGASFRPASSPKPRRGTLRRHQLSPVTLGRTRSSLFPNRPTQHPRCMKIYWGPPLRYPVEAMPTPAGRMTWCTQGTTRSLPLLSVQTLRSPTRGTPALCSPPTVNPTACYIALRHASFTAVHPVLTISSAG
jgi:hypothetical protein